LENTELIEHFSHQLAAKAGINVAKTRTIKISKDRDLLISECFDRTAEGRRIHFASAMSLLGFDDGAGSSTGNGFLDIVDFILRGCTNVRQNLREHILYVGMNYKKKQLHHYSICSLSRNALLSAEIYRKTYFSAGYRDFLPNIHFSF
jgi:hypothetical protein